MTRRFLILLLLYGTLCAVTPLLATQPIKEIILVSSILKDNTDICAKIVKHAHTMRAQATPFLNPKHQAKYRFKPSEKPTREILSLVRTMKSKFKLLSGILYHAPVKNKSEIFKSLDKSTDTITKTSKRALRAIAEGDHTLYIASAQTADREAKTIYGIIAQLENEINEVIQKTDDAMENL